jgi:DNA-binding response OmpR family regulator
MRSVYPEHYSVQAKRAPSVVTAKDATEVLRRMEALELEGIVLDLNLGGESGLLLLELMKEKHPGVPILAYTGMDLEPR